MQNYFYILSCFPSMCSILHWRNHRQSPMLYTNGGELLEMKNLVCVSKVLLSFSNGLLFFWLGALEP